MGDVTTREGLVERMRARFGDAAFDVPFLGNSMSGALKLLLDAADERDRYRTATIEVRYAMMNNPGVTPAAFAFLSKVIDEALSPSGGTPAGEGDTIQGDRNEG